MNRYFAGKRHVFMMQSILFMTSLQHVTHFHIPLKSCLSLLEIIRTVEPDETILWSCFDGFAKSFGFVPKTHEN